MWSHSALMWIKKVLLQPFIYIYKLYSHFFPIIQGYGQSPDSEAPKSEQNRVELLSKFMESLGIKAAVLVSPSMSGHYSIPFLMKNNAQLKAFVPVAPVGTRSYSPQEYQNIQVRNYRLWWKIFHKINWDPPDLRFSNIWRRSQSWSPSSPDYYTCMAQMIKYI